MQIKKYLYSIILILVLSCSMQKKIDMIDPPPEILDEINLELQNTNIPESKKKAILEKVKLSENYGKKSYAKIEEMEKRITDLENSLSVMAEETKNLKSELEYYKNIERKIITSIFILVVVFSVIGLASLFFKFRKFFGILI